MVSLYIKQFKSKWFILFLISIIIMNIYFYRDYHSSGGTLENWLIYGNFITTFVNNAFFIFSLNRVKVFQNVKDLCSLRINDDKLINRLLTIALLNMIVYIVLCYSIVMYQFQLILNLKILIRYIFITVVMFMVYEILYIIVILDKRKFYLLFCPFIFNLVYHYIFVFKGF